VSSRLAPHIDIPNKEIPMTKTINVGIIGAGSIAERGHIPGYLDQPDAKVVGVCDVVGERARRVAVELDAAHA